MMDTIEELVYKLKELYPDAAYRGDDEKERYILLGKIELIEEIESFYKGDEL